MGILRQNYELILKRQRKSWDFFIFNYGGEGGSEVQVPLTRICLTSMDYIFPQMLDRCSQADLMT